MTRYFCWPVTLLALIIGGCDRVEYFPDKPLVNTETKIIAHRGGGFFDEGNTLEACKFGLKMADGIEVDIQKTADNVLWLSHSSLTVGCGSFESQCFASLKSDAIVQVDTCLGNQFDYVRLDDIFKLLEDSYPEKYISLDVKAWSPCGVSHINIVHEMNQLAQVIIDLSMKYHVEKQVMVESESGDFLYYIKKRNRTIGTYLVSLGDFELGISRALDAGFSGVSFHYKFNEPITKQQVELLHRKGLKIQLWTVDDQDDLAEAKSINPDFIQTDVL